MIDHHIDIQLWRYEICCDMIISRILRSVQTVLFEAPENGQIKFGVGTSRELYFIARRTQSANSSDHSNCTMSKNEAISIS
jgi:hypothetical protein